MIRVPVRDLIRPAVGARLLRGDLNVVATGVSTDSRTAKKGDVYVALAGPNFDGNQFAADAASRGVAAVLLRTTRELLTAPGLARLTRALPDRMPILLHDSPRRALAAMGRWRRDALDIPVIGITGSCGKTSTKNVLSELLAARFSSVVSSPSSYNNEIGVPHTLLLTGDETDALVVEIGTNAPGEIAHLSDIAQPTVGILTCIGAAHLEGLGSVEGVAEEKADLIRAVDEGGFVVLNAECRFTKHIASQTRARVVTFSVDGSGDFDARDLKGESGETSFTLHSPGGKTHEVRIPMIGRHNVQNVIAAMAACHGLGMTIEELLPLAAGLHGTKHRMERIELEDGVTLYDDTYNANPESAQASLQALCAQAGHARRVLILGDMLELGPLAAELHFKVGVTAAEYGVDFLCLVGDLVRATAAGALQAGLPADKLLHLSDLRSAEQTVPGLLRAGDVALVKGSRAMGLDRLVAKLREDRSAKHTLKPAPNGRTPGPFVASGQGNPRVPQALPETLR